MICDKCVYSRPEEKRKCLKIVDVTVVEEFFPKSRFYDDWEETADLNEIVAGRKQKMDSKKRKINITALEFETKNKHIEKGICKFFEKQVNKFSDLMT